MSQQQQQQPLHDASTVTHTAPLHLLYKGHRPGEAARVAQGEGPLWDEQLGVLYWLDNTDGAIFRYNAQTGEHQAVGLGRALGFFALTEVPDRILLLGHHGISLFDWSTVREYQLMGVPRPPNGRLDLEVDPLLRFNEGLVDAHGRLLAGTYSMDEANGKDAAELYSIVSTNNEDPTQPQLKILHTLATKVWISNGLGWNSDSTHMYFVDSMLRSIDRFDYNLSTGSVSNRMTLVRFPQEYGLPDGLAVDQGGDIWVAHFAGSRITRSSPSGRILETIPIPVNQVPSICFGGEPQEGNNSSSSSSSSLSSLYIVTGARNPDYVKEPLAGSLLVWNKVTDHKGNRVQGKIQHRFKGKITVDEKRMIQHNIREKISCKPNKI